MKSILYPLALSSIFLVFFTGSAVAFEFSAKQQCALPQFATETIVADGFRIGIQAAPNNQCCVAGTDTITGNNFCFCTCPGDVQHHEFGTLVCQIGGITNFQPAPGVLGVVVDDCSGNDDTPILPEPALLEEEAVSVLENVF